jgi:hypothetical protein
MELLPPSSQKRRRSAATVASDAASYVTGTVLAVGGGYTAI